MAPDTAASAGAGDPGDCWLTTAQVAALHGVSRRAVLFWIKSGQLPAEPKGAKEWCVLESDARAFQRRSPGRPPVLHEKPAKS